MGQEERVEIVDEAEGTLDPLAAINQADAALANADDIVDILELRTMAKAAEVIAIAEGFGDMAQKAKVFQLKAERKAGAWLAENIQPGRPSADEKRVTLADLQIEYNDSSRWQLMATVPDEKFYGWLDERLAKGQEITAGGLRMYAKNLSGGKVTTPGVSGNIALIPKGCALTGFMVRCDGPITGGHIINKSKTRGNADARQILVDQAAEWHRTHKAEIMAAQCSNHNVSRIADSRAAVKIMLYQKCFEYGYDHMEAWFDEFLGTFKERPHELELRVLLS